MGCSIRVAMESNGHPPRPQYAWCADKPITTESAIEEGAKAAVKVWMDENPAVVGSAIEKAVCGYLDDNGMPESDR